MTSAAATTLSFHQSEELISATKKTNIIMRLPPLIYLPPFERGQTVLDGDALYYDDNGRNKEHAGEYVLTAKGDDWTTRYWKLYPFLRPNCDESNRPLPVLMTDAGKLDFVKLIIQLFGVGSTTTSPFVGNIIKDLNEEIVRRCKDDNMKLSDGTDPTNVDDVFEIIKSLKGKPDHVIFNYIFNWVSSVTLGDNAGWINKSIRRYLRSCQLPLELPPDDSLPDTIQKHSLNRLAVKNGTAATKLAVRNLQLRYFGKVLNLERIVHSKATIGSAKNVTYMKKLNDPTISTVVFKDLRFVPSTRLENGAYYLNTPDDKSSPSTVLLHLTNAINASPNTPLSELIAMLTSSYNSQNVLPISTNLPQQAVDTHHAVPITAANEAVPTHTHHDVLDIDIAEADPAAMSQAFLNGIQAPQQGVDTTAATDTDIAEVAPTTTLPNTAANKAVPTHHAVAPQQGVDTTAATDTDIADAAPTTTVPNTAANEAADIAEAAPALLMLITAANEAVPTHQADPADHAISPALLITATNEAVPTHHAVSDNNIAPRTIAVSEETAVSEKSSDAPEWKLVKVFTSKQLNIRNPSQCDDDDCDLAACCKYKCDDGDEYKCCVDCQESWFDGWPPSEEMPVSINKTHQQDIISKCSAKPNPVMPNIPRNKETPKTFVNSSFIYHKCSDSICTYVSCDPCKLVKVNSAMNVDANMGKKRGRQGGLRGRDGKKKKVGDCHSDPSTLQTEKGKNYFTQFLMETNNREKCSDCGKYFKPV
eukprot:scaffold13935_cov167-Skeletonema_marinoi.AAC.2